ncbi:MAG: hypothetical protein Q9163_000389 [Psora crenata]
MAEAYTKNSPLEEDDSEWEYEYHDTETESFYVTLDLSSSASVSRPKQLSPATNTTGPPTSNTISEIPIDPQIRGDANATPPQPGSPPAGGTEPRASSDAGNRIQILDLHSTNPLISYQDQLYSCTWGSTIGTDVLVTAQTSPPIGSDQDQSKSSLHRATVLATTRTKLSARPVQAIPRTGAESSEQNRHAATFAADSSASAAATNPAKIDIGPNPSCARQQQAAFLERLIAIKAAKGEKDTVNINVPKRAQPTTEGGSGAHYTEFPGVRHDRFARPRRRGASATRRVNSLFKDHRPRPRNNASAGPGGGRPPSGKNGSEGFRADSDQTQMVMENASGQSWRQTLTEEHQDEWVEDVLGEPGDADGEVDTEMEDI